MADSTKKLTVEGLDSTFYETKGVRQRSKSAGCTTTNSYEEGVTHQYRDINKMKDSTVEMPHQETSSQMVEGTNQR